MNYLFTEVTNKLEWDSYIQARNEANFLQSWEWGEFHKALGKKVARYCIQENNTVVGLIAYVKETAKRGSYLTVAGGPLLDWTNISLVTYAVEQIKRCAQVEGAHFVRFRPQQTAEKSIHEHIHSLGAVTAPMHLTADLTLQLDLNQTEDDILKKMRKNTRYEIKKAEKLGIITKLSTNPNDIQKFYDEQLIVAKKHSFVPFSYAFFHEQFKAFQETGNVVLISSHIQDTLLAQAFIIFYNNEAVYHYGISTEANSKLPGSYACQWRAIQEAKQRACDKYNFWGIAPENQPQHRFAGVSLFKRGFGGDEIKYIAAHDFPVSTLYWITYTFERLRRWSRKL